MSTTGVMPLHIFRFQVEVQDASLSAGPQGDPIVMDFAECTGLEATMEPKTIKEGGRNFGAAQRTGVITFATVVLKRGVSEDVSVWNIFNAAAAGEYAPRLQVTISLLDGLRTPLIGWQLANAMPVKFKFADFNAKGTEVGIEELHLVHEGIQLL
jgi:phage tail-like protein